MLLQITVVSRMPLRISKRHGSSACCSLTFGYCFHIISSVAQRTYITQHAFSGPKYLLRFLIPYKYILNCNETRQVYMFVMQYCHKILDQSITFYM